jgi:hypothetical protein
MVLSSRDMNISDDEFTLFMERKKFLLDETGYYYKKIGDSWINCDTDVDHFSMIRNFEVKVVTPKGDDIFVKRYADFDEFESIITMVIREERLKILLDE